MGRQEGTSLLRWFSVVNKCDYHMDPKGMIKLVFLVHPSGHSSIVITLLGYLGSERMGSIGVSWFSRMCILMGCVCSLSFTKVVLHGLQVWEFPRCFSQRQRCWGYESDFTQDFGHCAMPFPSLYTQVLEITTLGYDKRNIGVHPIRESMLVWHNSWFGFVFRLGCVKGNSEDIHDRLHALNESVQRQLKEADRRYMELYERHERDKE